MTDPADAPHRSPPAAHPRPSSGTHDSSPPTPPTPDEVILRVAMRPAAVARMRAFAAREGASVEALAALWLEEKLAEADQMTGGRPAPPAEE